MAIVTKLGPDVILNIERKQELLWQIRHHISINHVAWIKDIHRGGKVRNLCPYDRPLTPKITLTQFFLLF